MSQCFSHVALRLGAAAIALAACNGDADRLTSPDASTTPSYSASPAGTSTQPGGTNPLLVMFPKAIDSLAVGDSVRLVPTGSYVSAKIEQRWSASDSTVLKVSSSGWVRAVKAGLASAMMTPQKAPYPVASTRFTVVARSATPTPPPAIPPGTPTPPAPAPVVAPSAGAAALPRVLLDTRMPAVTGHTIAVPAGGNLQAALDAAQPGDAVTLAPGATYTGNFLLKPKPGMTAGQWITVRTAGALGAEGVRVDPATAATAAFPKVLTPNAAPAFATVAGAQGWRLTGLEIGPAAGVTLNYILVSFGDGSAAQNSLAQVPSRLVLDRAYVHGGPTLDVRRCVALNSASSAVIDSYVSECHSRNGDSQAIWGWNGPGPFKIVNNHLEGGHEGLGFGGADPAINGLIPSDIEIRQNHVIRPLAWKHVWPAKNMLELKTGARVLIEGNLFENNWVDAQNGFAFVWWSVNQNGHAPWTQTSDVTFRYNQVLNVAGGFNLTATYSTPSQPLTRVTIMHNVVTGLDATNGRAFQVNGAVSDLTIVNNSGLGVNNDVLFNTPGQPLARFTFQNNITGGHYTLFAAGSMGAAGLAKMQIPVASVSGNVFVGANAANVPTGNQMAASAGSGFLNYAGANLMIAPSSPLQSAGTGGSRPGADLTLVAKYISTIAP